jgi:amidase
MTRSITDGAILLSMISGKDPNDTRTMSQPDQVPDYTKALNKDALQGKRIGVPRRVFLESGIFDISDEDLAWVNKEFEQALDIIRSLGAIVVDPADMPSADEIPKTTATETLVFCTDFKVSFTKIRLKSSRPFRQVEINRWFEALLENPSGVRSLAGLIQFNKDKPQLENFPHFDQSRFVVPVACRECSPK